MRVKKALENLHFWVGGESGEIYVGVRDKYGGIGERVVVTEKVLDVARKYDQLPDESRTMEEDLTKLLDLDGAINEYFKKEE